jgi:hypothetical protein
MERFDRINRVILYRILLKLFNDDSVAGRNIFDQACRDYPTFDQWEERDHIELLLEAFDQDDKDLISQRCQVKSSCFFFFQINILFYFRNHILWPLSQNLFV